MADDQKPNQMQTLLDGAIAMNELFMSYVQAGFTRAEALQLVLGHLAICVQQNKPET
jgi:hypothetical protein